jgi:hypothetical protein
MFGSLRRHDPDQVPAVGGSPAALSARSAPDSRAIRTTLALILEGAELALDDRLDGRYLGRHLGGSDQWARPGRGCQWASIVCSHQNLPGARWPAACRPGRSLAHRCKGCHGWHLDMPAPSPGLALPHGRTYLTTAQPCPV